MMPGWLRRGWHHILANALALAPLALLAFEYVRGDLDATLNRDLTLRTGSAGLLLLAASFACTPLNTLFGWRWAIQVRRTLGLYGFGYVALHLLSYAALDALFDFELIWRDVGERRSMLVGFVAFLALVPLAITSTRGWQRRLGHGWKRLHRLVYVALPLSVLHYLWLDRDIIWLPLVYAAAIAILLTIRIPPLRRAIARARSSAR